jgi:hypothetical protein
LLIGLYKDTYTNHNDDRCADIWYRETSNSPISYIRLDVGSSYSSLDAISRGKSGAPTDTAAPGTSRPQES